MQGLQELLNIVMAGFHNQCLCMMGTAQQDWFAHVLWALHEKIYNFFQMKLVEEDLLKGAMLANPLMVFNCHISKFKKLSKQPVQMWFWLQFPQQPWQVGKMVEDISQTKMANGQAKEEAEI